MSERKEKTKPVTWVTEVQETNQEYWIGSTQSPIELHNSMCDRVSQTFPLSSLLLITLNSWTIPRAFNAK